VIPSDAITDREPDNAGWYECWTFDDRWNGGMRYRAWGNGLWWIPLVGGWLSGPAEGCAWRGPVADVMGPAPDGTNP
jgi:hypothetical protein